MALTQDEMTSVVSAVLSSLQTNSRTIDQLTPVSSLADSDSFEINGGKRVTYKVLRELIASLSTNEQNSLKTLIGKCELKSVSITVAESSATLTISSVGKSISTQIPIATDKKAGLMTAADKLKLQNAYDTATTAKETADSAKTAAANAQSAADKALKEKIDKSEKNEPGGVATLDNYGQIPVGQIPFDKLRRICVFDGFTDMKPDLAQVGASGEDLSVIYDRQRMTFIASRLGSIVTPITPAADSISELPDIGAGGVATLGEWYGTWLNGTQYGDQVADGIKPTEDRIYIDRTDASAWWWNGEELMLVGSKLELGEILGTAYPGEKGKKNADDITKLHNRLVNLDGPDGFCQQADAQIQRNTKNIKTLNENVNKLDKTIANLSPLGNDFNVTDERRSKDEPRELPDGGTTYYDVLSTAIAYAVERGNVVKPGVHLTFALAEKSWKSYTYVGGVNDDPTREDLWEDQAAMTAGDEPLINVNALCGPGPIAGGYYNLSYAIAAVVSKELSTGITYRKPGLKLTYNTGEFQWETKQFVGLIASFNDAESWTDVSGNGGGMQIEVSDTPEEDGEKAFSTGGAAKIAIGGHTVDIVEGAVNVQLQNLLGEDILEEPIVIPNLGGGGGTVGGTTIAISAEKSAVYAAFGASMLARFAIRSVTITGNQEIENSIARVWIVDNDTKQELWSSNDMQASSSYKEDYSFSIELKDIFSSASSKNLRIYAQDEHGNQASRRFSATAEDVTLTCVQTLHYDASAGLTVESESASFQCYQFQKATSDINVHVEMMIGGEWTPIHEQLLTGNRRNAARSITFSPKGLGLTHGAWAIRMWGESAQSGVKGNTVYSTVMIAEPGNDTPIAAMRYNDTRNGTVRIYDTLNIEVAAYKAGNISGVEVELAINGMNIAKPLVLPTKTVLVSKSVQGYDEGKKLQIQAHCGSSASPDVILTIEGWAVEVHPKENALCSFDFASRSNNEADHTIEDGSVRIDVQGANWSSNGFRAYAGDEHEETALRVAEDVTAEVTYAPFGNQTLESNGCAMQMRILTDNVKDSDAMLMHCYDAASGAGFYIKGNEAAIYCKTGVPALARRKFPCGSKHTVAVVVEPADEYIARDGVRYSSLVMYLDGERAAKIGYIPGTGALSTARRIMLDGHDGDIYLYNLTIWQSWYEWHEAVNNSLAKLGDTETMIAEYEFEDVLQSQTAEGFTMMRPGHAALWDRGIPYIVEVASQEEFDKFDGIDTPGVKGGGTDTSENFVIDLYYYNPRMPWRSFVAKQIRKRRQGTTSAKRCKKNERYYIGKGTGVEPIFPDYAKENALSAEDAEDLEKVNRLFALNMVRVGRHTIPVNVITEKIDWSDSTGANDCGVCDMMNATYRAMGPDYMTPAQRAFDGTWEKGDVRLTGLEMNHSTANHICAVFRSTDAALSNVFFEAKGNWKEDKGEQTALGFMNTPGYNKGCHNWQDEGFKFVVAPKGVTVNDWIMTAEFKTKTETWDKNSLYLVLPYCGRNYRFMRFGTNARTDSWEATHGSMKQVNGKWQVEGDVLNPVSGVEIITYDGMAWFQGVTSLEDFMAPKDDAYSSWIEKLRAKGKISGAVPAWTYYFESMVDNDDLQVAYARGEIVPFELYQMLRYFDFSDYTKQNWEEKFKQYSWKFINMKSAMVYKGSSDYNAMKDSLSKNCQPMHFLEDGHSVVDGVYDPEREGADSIDGFNHEFVTPTDSTGQMPMVMYVNKVYDVDGANDKDNDGDCNFDAETDPDKPTSDDMSYVNPFAGWGSVLWRGLYLQPDVVVDASGLVQSMETTVATMRALQVTLEDGRIINPFSPAGAVHYFIEERTSKWPKNVSSFDGWRKYEQYAATSATIDFYALQGLGLTSLREFIEKRWRIRDGFYRTGDFFSGQLTGRIYYGDAPGNDTGIRVVAAKPGYFGVGNDSPRTCTDKVKLEAGEEYRFAEFPFKSNSLLYMHQADRLREIDLHELTLSGFDFSVMKLVERIVIGGEDYVRRSVTTGSPLTSIALGNLPFLRELDCRRHEVQNIDASGCPRLATLDARGSELSSLRLAEACKTNDVRLPATMTLVRLVGLPELTYRANAEMSGLTFEGMGKVNTLIVRDSPKIDASALIKAVLTDQTEEHALAYLYVTGVELRGEGDELLTIVRNGVQGTDGEVSYPKPVMIGDYMLTRIIEESDIAEIENGITGLHVEVVLDAYINAIDGVNAEYYGGMEEVGEVTLDNVSDHIDWWNGETYEEWFDRFAEANAPLDI